MVVKLSKAQGWKSMVVINWNKGGCPKQTDGGDALGNNSQRSTNASDNHEINTRHGKPKERGYAPVWHAAANLNPLEMAARDSTSLERRSHIYEKLRNNGQWGEYNISRSSDGNCNGYVREWSPPWLNEGNMPQYGIRCTRSILICVKDLICTPLKWWRGNLGTRHNFVQEPRLYQRVRI